MGRVLGDLNRIVTSDDHVKWVCRYHYRENYREEAAQDLQDGVGGQYEKSVGSATVDISSSIVSRNLYTVLASSRLVQSLEVRFKWAPSMRALRELSDAITSTNIIEVTIKRPVSGPLLSDASNNDRRSDPLLQMVSGGNFQIFRLCGRGESLLDYISTIPTTLIARKFQIDYEENWQKRVPHLVSILQASPVLYCL